MRANLKRRYLVAFTLLLLFGILGTGYSVVVPLWEAPDEIGHVSFVTHLRHTHSLPIQQPGVTGSAHHPPLYYLLVAIASLPADINDATGAFRPNSAFVWAGQGGQEVNIALHTSGETFPFVGQSLLVHLARLASVLMGLVTVAFIIGLGWEVFPRRAEIGLLAGTLTAFNPQFLFISGAVNNDNLLVMGASGAWFFAIRALRDPSRWRAWLVVGIWLAVAILAKVSGLVIAAAIGLLLVACALRQRSLRLLIQCVVAVGLPVLLLTGWWFIRNQVLYGDPMGWQVYQEVYRANLRTAPLQWSNVQHFFTTQINSFGGLFGWMNLWAPAWFYTGIRILGLAGLVGLGLFLARRFRSLTDFQKGSFIFLALATVVQEAYLLMTVQYFNESWYQGRYLFSVIGPAMLLLSIGIVGWQPKIPARLTASGLTIGLVGVAIFMLVRVIGPAYHTIPLAKWQLWLIPNRTTAQFGGQFALRNYQITTGPEKQIVTLTLYWQALQKPDPDYSAFVHLIDAAGQVVAQKDHAPGEDRGYPPSVWSTGDIIEDPHVLTLSKEQSSGVYRFRVGLYNWKTGAQLPASLQGAPSGNFVILEKSFSLSR